MQMVGLSAELNIRISDIPSLKNQQKLILLGQLN